MEFVVKDRVKSIDGTNRLGRVTYIHSRDWVKVLWDNSKVEHLVKKTEIVKYENSGGAGSYTRRNRKPRGNRKVRKTRRH
jgi:hypothetical protein